MKKGKYIIIILMLVTAPILSIQVVAHPPEDMVLEYEYGAQNLNVTITHNTVDPNSHYIEQVDIKKNGVLYLSETYTSQPTTSTFTYNYTVEAEDGDELTVTAYCSIAGSIQRTLTVVGNQPPGAPTIDGPTTGDIGIPYDFIFNAVDPDGDDVKYFIDWGDGDTDETGLNPSGTDVILSHSWDTESTFTITAYAQDEHGKDGVENTLVVAIGEGNHAPSAPDIDGTINGKTGVSYDYTFNAVDPDGDDVKYFIDWGDGDTDETGLNPSGEDVKVKHTWNSDGSYIIRAYAEDEFGLVGPEATLTVTMPRNRAVNTPFLSFLQQHPNLFPILQQILQRLGLQ
jgi:hypothetical protein